ncbi:SDR family NAD(P)-dependent oxidoreductase [bacterium]|nr:SDR family NAD(P)-dependent oxidoreductase [bacterium]
MKKEKILILGARRGLGFEILKLWKARFPNDEVYASSRQPFEYLDTKTFHWDLTVGEDVENLLQTVDKLAPQKVFYVAGGGPYGVFSEKQWKDHQWALQLTLLTPTRLLHHCLNKSFIEQFIMVGSAIAESNPDPGAASYAAAKHGLKGLLATLKTETSKDLRLFSPGYMNTSMLPRLAQHKINAHIEDASVVAAQFIDWAQNPKASWHWEGRPR